MKAGRKLAARDLVHLGPRLTGPTTGQPWYAAGRGRSNGDVFQVWFRDGPDAASTAALHPLWRADAGERGDAGSR
jgi:hypothetical protein